jgi:hypothetical protein
MISTLTAAAIRGISRRNAASIAKDQSFLFLKQKPSRLSGRYQSELRSHLRPGNRLSSRRAETFGKRAVLDGLGTLELADMHAATRVIGGGLVQSRF